MRPSETNSSFPWTYLEKSENFFFIFFCCNSLNMKGVLTAICALALLGSATTTTFPNDLYYSHHPDLAVADFSDSGNILHCNW